MRTTTNSSVQKGAPYSYDSRNRLTLADADTEDGKNHYIPLQRRRPYD
ncbi:hypothetical protein [Paenibacillus sp. 481]|nr:hypothetical protein [Paenibacillus sp. 481]UHA74897.1 hypothetical protein KIK04_07610 [Paenibacillus sp. 481]